MPPTNQPADVLRAEDSPKKLPEMLNVLTILTFVGCGLGVISSFMGYVGAEKNYNTMVDMQGKMDKVPDFAKKMVGPEAVELLRRAMENKLPILLVNLVAMGLCLYGAIQMRKWQKSGYYIYVIGELLPLVGSYILIGGLGAGMVSVLLALVFPLLFVGLYASQLKHLK